ncbi:MAG: hypothetical protein ACJAYE_000731 [Candidatus Azotimanducaceae bacterium]|jgi:hypothetical protein
MTAESSQLVKCLVQNPAQQTSYRLIERESFDLWHYLVSTKHNIKLLETSLCMWLSNKEFIAKEDIYLRAGSVEQADRIMLMVFDETGNFANTTRYVLSDDSTQLENILISHVPLTQRKEAQYTMQRDNGYLVVTGPLQQLKLLETAKR